MVAVLSDSAETLDEMKRRVSFFKRGQGNSRRMGGLRRIRRPQFRGRAIKRCKRPARWLRKEGHVMRSRKHPHRVRETATSHLNELLDEALKETFPASDPIAIDVERLRRRDSDEAPAGTFSQVATKR